MKVEKLLLLFALFGMMVSSCKDEDEKNEATEYITKYYTIGSGASTAGCYLSLRDDKVYRIISEDDVLTADEEYLKHVDLVFDGKEFYSPTCSNNSTIKSNGIKTHVNPFETGYFFETNLGYQGYIYFEDDTSLGDTKHNYKIRVEYKVVDQPSTIDETKGDGYVLVTDTATMVIGSKNGSITQYFSVGLMDTVNVKDQEKMKYVDFYQSLEDEDKTDFNLKIVDSKYNPLASSTHELIKQKETKYSYSLSNNGKYYEGTIEVMFTNYVGNFAFGTGFVAWTLQVIRTGKRAQ